jgi:hypothetical protein
MIMLGLPSLNIIFKETGSTAIERGTRGIVALILRDKTVPAVNPIILNGVDEIPSGLAADNQEQINLAFIGYKYPPKQVIVYVQADTATDYVEAQHYLETIKWDYVAVPGISDKDTAAFATWVKEVRDSKDSRVKAVLPNTVGDHEGIIDFCATTIKTANKTYNAKEYCARIAGLLAGTPLTISATYAPLSEVIDCDHLTKADMDSAIDAGKLILMNDGRKVKVARAVNSLVTTTEDKGKIFKKIKVIDIMDQIHDDIKSTVEDNYIGKVQNDYDHKILLISAISNYFDRIELDGLLDKGKSNVFVDTTAQKAYLKTSGYKTTDGKIADQMTEKEIKEANTEDQVFIAASIKILDAMENIIFGITV